MPRALPSVIVLATGLFAAGQAAASDWTVTIGGRAQAVVPYEGAGFNSLVPVPVIQVRRPDRPERPSMPGDALGIGLINTGAFSFGPAVRARGKRNADNDRAGLHEVNFAIEPGAFVTIWPTEWLRLHADGGRGVRGHRGWVADGGFDLVARPGRWMVSAGPRMGFGNEKYMDAYFAVSAAEAAANAEIAASGLGAYDPGGGRRYVGGVGTVAYHFTNRLQTTANLSYHRLSDRAALSPVVQTIGNRNEYSAGVGLKYSFGFSGF